MSNRGRVLLPDIILHLRLDSVLGLLDANVNVRFHGLTRTNMKLQGPGRHRWRIDSYKNLHTARTEAM